ncbi:GNAT family N-acetyltransferase [Zhongshania sp.]|uniref:GNAT family N-acetyltransferase n=1 Tax=Zhongshania sp. TaxID=1971902 RepID=UPI001B782A07|nr:GNAT family N-acetyltransferase [Zhongshania sp.]MBQ0794569.1 GNAT family N-acetyltransferase [Zhongshania sp.]|tara:strand:- start:19357 stop:19833 length:477 start_codon:yes stop_codon:yes gene_type:complete
MLVSLADYKQPRDRAAIELLMSHYALDPMGGGEALPDEVLSGLCDALAEVANAATILIFDGEKPAALATVLQGFSSFKCKPLLNIHDVIVLPAYRGQGLAQRLMSEVEKLARQRGCCKVTLEVLQGNMVAQAVYRRCGFAAYELDPELGQALFWQKEL